ncbi:MAG TPA: glycosyltransferase family 2 protein [Aggregatilineales bacterium]|nr:glycosyltransferase [Chloroflexota bacterium]HOA22963.1 glycosyltransferase family 2 protein [Aggregatilineales bacterium]HQA66784.1 glycosyltransferase family 2 protein [Aggregatilineales bacterium]HQE17931.1 glycosyltransferase family 2 protein [Aggregatilineales bacterium]
MGAGSLPLISIVTPTFNAMPYVEEAIESVLAQGYPAFEHIVIDGGSTDGTLDVLRRYPHLTWLSGPDKGQSDALNKGFRLARGDLVGWLNADDRYLPGCFERVAVYHTAHPKVDVIYGDYRWVDEAGEVQQVRRELDFDLFLLKYLHVLTIPTTTSFFRREVFGAGNLLDTSYHYAMDAEFYLRLALGGWRFGHLPALLADFRWHAGSKSTRQAAAQREEHLRALLTHDPLLSSVGARSRRAALVLRTVLMLLARTKRTLLKAARGYYFTQWRR